MASINVTEYAQLAVGAKGNEVPAGQEPSLAVQTVATTAESAAFQDQTRFVMITSTASQRIRFGSPAGSALATDTLILQGERFFGVFPGYTVANLDEA